MFIKRLRIYQILPVIIFSISFIFGYFTKIPTFNNNIKVDIISIFPNTFLGVLSNNLKVILTNLSGSVLFGLSTFVSMLYNGLLLVLKLKDYFLLELI